MSTQTRHTRLSGLEPLVITPDLLSSLLGRLAGGTTAQEG